MKLCVLNTSLLLCVEAFSVIFALTISLKGKERIEYNLGYERMQTDSINLIFKFRTIDPSGLIFYGTNLLRGDFICLELINGELRYTSKIGFDDKSDQKLVVGNNLNTYEWHRVNLTRVGRNVSITLDNVKNERYFDGDFEKIILGGRVYFGGVSDQVDLSLHQLTTRKFSGCLQNLMFNNIDIFYNAKYSEEKFQTFGDILWDRCEDIDYDPIMFQSQQDHALIPTFIKDSLNVVLNFRTAIKNGLIFFKPSKALCIYLALKDGVLTLEVDFAKRTENPILIKLGKDFNDGFWHRVEFLINSKKVMLQIEKFFEEVDLKKSYSHYPVQFDINNSSLAGGNEEKLGGFVGCIYNIWVDNTLIDFSKLGDEYTFGVIKKCELKDHCLFTPCQHGGICSQDFHSYKCDCSFIHYYGDKCQHSIFQQGCQAYKDLGVKEDSYCMIDPDGDKGAVKPFKVLCNMTSDSKLAFTILSHKKENSDIPIYMGEREGNTLKTVFDYGLSIEAIEVMFRSASVCQQFIQLKCRNTRLLNSPSGPAVVHWEGREGLKEDYWGGAPPDSSMCACGVNQTCADGLKFCNCDINDNIWREDSGFIYEIDRLPIMAIYANISANNSYLSVGALKCHFTNNVNELGSFKERSLAACLSVNAKPTELPTQKITTANFNGKQVEGWLKTIESTSATLENSILQKVNFNLTLAIPSNDADKDGLKLQLGKWAILSIAIMVVLVAIIIGVVCIVKRWQRSSNRTEFDDDDEYQVSNQERTEMCTFFGAVARNERNRPVIEVHRHSIHFDTFDELPPAYREYGDRSLQQPITTHIDLSYKSRKSGFFC
ncbi:contactin-associated protein-like 4 [Hydra vulgaris]|uniref:Contactin-associated protein-like 4 n=1 Tax=Hydra vulgaris TaxID=6087 RepID=A0ABM4DQ28_HYDVU